MTAKRYEPAEIDVKDPRNAAIGIALSLAVLLMPKEEGLTGDAKAQALIATFLEFLESAGYTVVRAEEMPR